MSSDGKGISMRTTVMFVLTLLSTFSGAEIKQNSAADAANAEESSPVGQPADGRKGDREAIRDHIDRIFHAYMQKDRATVRSTHAHDWHGFSLGTRKLVRGLDEYMTMAEKWLGDDSSRMTNYRFTEYQTIFHSDLALVFYIADVEGISRGVPYKDKFRSLDVYVKRNGDWTQLASNLDRHPDETERRGATPATITPELKKRALDERVRVWNAWFNNDQQVLLKLLPAELVAINNGEERWYTRDSVLEAAQQFAGTGARLVRLEFPRTEIQAYGSTLILFSTFVYELDTNGKREITSGRATETFVERDGVLVNTGWHLDSGK